MKLFNKKFIAKLLLSLITLSSINQLNMVNLSALSPQEIQYRNDLMRVLAEENFEIKGRKVRIVKEENLNKASGMYCHFILNINLAPSKKFLGLKLFSDTPYVSSGYYVCTTNEIEDEKFTSDLLKYLRKYLECDMGGNICCQYFNSTQKRFINSKGVLTHFDDIEKRILGLE